MLSVFIGGDGDGEIGAYVSSNRELKIALAPALEPRDAGGGWGLAAHLPPNRRTPPQGPNMVETELGPGFSVAFAMEGGFAEHPASILQQLPVAGCSWGAITTGMPDGSPDGHGALFASLIDRRARLSPYTADAYQAVATVWREGNGLAHGLPLRAAEEPVFKFVFG